MDSFAQHFPEDLHHAYIIEGGSDAHYEALIAFLESRNIPVRGNPNVFSETYDSLTIDSSRTLRQYHAEKSAIPGKKVCIIRTLGINREAEHTLLKLLEEPTADTHFFIFLPNVDTLLDTLLSRVHVVRPFERETTQEAQTFMASTPKDRIAFIADVIASHKNDETSAPLRAHAQRLVKNSTMILAQGKRPFSKDDRWKLGELEKAGKYLSLPGASVKMILEHISLIL